MIFDVRALAAQKVSETDESMAAWFAVLESARQSLRFIEVDYQALEHLALACQSTAQLTILTRLIYQYGKSNPHGALITDVILEYVNDSPFSLLDWICSIEYFYHWLEERSVKINFQPMLKYLTCCITSQDALESGQTLMALIQDMLQVFGYEGSSSVQGRSTS